MKSPFHKTSMLAGVAIAALAFAPSMANAQTEPVTATVTVQNTLTLTEVDPLDFGTVAAIAHTVNTAELSIDAATGVLAITNNAPAVFAVIDNTTATRAQITVEDGADGANINFTINNVTNPIFGGRAFTLTNWETSWNGGAVTARTFNTPFAYQFASAFSGGVNELNIGASIITTAAPGTYSDGVYVGSFDVVASY